MMPDPYVSSPSVGFFGMLIIGIVAGYIAGRVRGEQHRFFTRMIVGIAGAFVGGKLSEMAGFHVYGFWSLMIAAIVGAVIVLILWRVIREV